MEYKRTIYDYLLQWKSRKNRKPLVLRGARQVGKTTVVKEFAKTYQNVILLNLEKKADRRYFEENEDVKLILDALFLRHNISAEQETNILLFIDEVQESPKAIQLLRYFYEEIPELHVIAAGSLLEFAIKDVKSFPVGRVEYAYMHPLNFIEFLEAMGQNAALKVITEVPIAPYAHQTLKDWFHRYAIIGGMPEVVKTYKENESVSALSRVYESIWNTYQDDVGKYAKNESEAKIIRHIMATAFVQLDQRIKFQNFGNSNYRSREVSEAMHKLDAAKMLQLIYPTTQTEHPIIPDIKKSPRLQFLDTGLVNYSLKLQAEMIQLKDLSYEYKGALIPHLITQEIISLNQYNYHKPNFWVREEKSPSAEVDLVVSSGKYLIPIEIKSGAAGKLRSLHQFIDQGNHGYAVRIYGGEFSIEKHQTPRGRKAYTLMNVPYYLGTKLTDYLNYFIKNY